MADLAIIYQWENDSRIRAVSEFRQPVSAFAVEQYILSCHTDPFQSGQIRLMAVLKSSVAVVGHVDLFEVNALHRRAGIGILLEPEERGKGYATEILSMVEGWGSEHLGLHQLWCQIALPNPRSIQLFTHAGYTKIGTLKEWFRSNKTWADTVIMQKILR